MNFSSLGFDLVPKNTDGSFNIPPRKVNGGLYTGEPAQPGAGYGNVPVLPAIAYWTHENLKSANPPEKARYWMNVGYRPGNNTDPIIPGVKYQQGYLTGFCIPPVHEPSTDIQSDKSCRKVVIYPYARS